MQKASSVHGKAEFFVPCWSATEEINPKLCSACTASCTYENMRTSYCVRFPTRSHASICGTMLVSIYFPSTHSETLSFIVQMEGASAHGVCAIWGVSCVLMQLTRLICHGSRSPPTVRTLLFKELNENIVLHWKEDAVLIPSDILHVTVTNS